MRSRLHELPVLSVGYWILVYVIGVEVNDMGCFLILVTHNELPGRDQDHILVIAAESCCRRFISFWLSIVKASGCSYSKI